MVAVSMSEMTCLLLVGELWQLEKKGCSSVVTDKSAPPRVDMTPVSHKDGTMQTIKVSANQPMMNNE